MNSDLFFGLVAVALGIYFGLCTIAGAINSIEVNVGGTVKLKADKEPTQ